MKRNPRSIAEYSLIDPERNATVFVADSLSSLAAPLGISLDEQRERG